MVVYAVIGVGQAQELIYEMTYFETDLNTGESRDIAVKPKASLASAMKSQLAESLTVSAGVSTSLQSVSSSQEFPGQSSFPQKSAAFGYHGIGNSQVTAGGYTTSSVSYPGVRNVPATGTGFPSDDVRKFSSGRTEPHSGVYSVASSRLPVQHTASKPGTDAGNWADRRLGPEAVKAQDDYQRGQIVNSRRDQAGVIQYDSGRHLAANVPSASMQVSSISL